MKEVVLRIAWRAAACAAVSWFGWHSGGAFGLGSSLALWGVALARPLLDLASETRHQIRAAVWHSVQGRHFAFQGMPVQVLEDVDHRRWLSLADVRRCVGFTASDGALALTYPGGLQSMGHPAQAHVGAEALVLHLTKESSPAALKFRHWVEREVAFPARRQRERLGVRA